ncbi:MAG: hypothetical protein AVDCRST_MAG19-4468 [uncultured Thermomicrobiales bacterium]|uniref:Uncharacterized protein n=1 Tax=uncultured Thermomicrobiales bacterium TaxID=1645740 RepID=A0A6J4VQ15_9BACT|nr:MAG: hypothetical protein AVDCRST_MAG19-4468 [uncultured Thermomicrobiales bacterium]
MSPGLRQRVAPPQRLEPQPSLPVRQEFLPLERGSFKDEPSAPVRGDALHDGDRVETDDALLLAVVRMEMGRRIFGVEHPDDDPMELRDGWPHALRAPVVPPYGADPVYPRQRPTRRSASDQRCEIDRPVAIGIIPSIPTR